MYAFHNGHIYSISGSVSDGNDRGQCAEGLEGVFYIDLIIYMPTYFVLYNKYLNS